MFQRDLLFRELYQLENVGFKPNREFEVGYKDYDIKLEDPNQIVKEVAVRPFTQEDRTALYADLLASKLNKEATRKNNLHKNNKFLGVDIAVLIDRLKLYVDLGVIEQALSTQRPDIKIDKQKAANEVFTEAIRQFQAKIFMSSAEWDGVIGPSTLSSLGFVFHQNKSFTPEKANPTIRKIFEDIDKAIIEYTQDLNIPLPDINGRNWFSFIINPSIFGRRGKNFGFHLFLVIKLREVENSFYTLLSNELTNLFDTKISPTPGFKTKSYGQVPRLVGMALNIRENHGDIRSVSPTTPKSRHLSGFAIDIDYTYNPWIKGTKGLTIIKEALKFTKNQTLSTSATTAQGLFAELAKKNQTAEVFDILKDYNDACVAYYNQSKFSKLKTIHWGSSSRSPNEGFLNLRKELVVALRDRAGLGWGAVDFGTGDMGNGDIMHFDMRTSKIGQAYSIAIGQGTINNYLREVHPQADKIKSQKSQNLGSPRKTQENVSSDSVRSNRIYGEKLGWYQYIYQINDLLLPFSGQSNVSLGEEAFAEAVAKWQEKNGFTGRDADGVIGPNTWRKLSRQLGTTSNSATTSPSQGNTSVSGASNPSGGIPGNDRIMAKINEYNGLIEATGEKYDMHPNIIRAIIAAESGGDRYKRSSANYKGLMQAERGDDQYDPKTSIETGTKKFAEFKNLSLIPRLKNFGVEASQIDQKVLLSLVIASYNAGPVTVLKALEYAYQSGDWKKWMDAENYQRALVFSGGYHTYENCTKNETADAIKEAKQKRVSYAGWRGKGKWQNFPNPPELSVLENTAPKILMCWVKTKHKNTYPYIARFLKYL